MSGKRSILDPLVLLIAMPLCVSMSMPAAALTPDTITPRPVAHPVPASDVGKAPRQHVPSPCDPKDFETKEAVAMCWANWANSMTPKPK